MVYGNFTDNLNRYDGKSYLEKLQEENEDLKLMIWWENASPETKRRINRRIYLESIGIDWRELEIQ